LKDKEKEKMRSKLEGNEGAWRVSRFLEQKNN